MKWLTAILMLFALSSPTTGDDLVVVVNKHNPTEKLSKSQVIDIFLGRYVVFPNGNSAHPLDVSEEALRGSFYQQLTNLSLARINAYWSRIKFSGKARRPSELSSESDIVEYLEQDRDGIAYISVSSLTDDLKVVFVLDE